MHSSFVRLVVAALAASVITAGGGAVLDHLRFGGDLSDARSRLQQEIQQRFDDNTVRLRTASDAIARESGLITRATDDRNALPELFARLDTARTPRAAMDALSVYVPDGTGHYRLLAWSDGAAEDLDLRSPWLPDVSSAVTAVVPGTMGLRLIALSPVGDQQGVATAESLLTTAGPLVSGAAHYRVSTRLGDVSITPVILPPGQTLDDAADRLLVFAPDGRPLVEVTVDPATLVATRSAFRGRVSALSLLPLLLLMVVAITRLLLARRHRQSSRRFVAISTLLALTLVLAGLGALALARTAALPATTDFVVIGVTALGVALALPVALWWRGAERRSFHGHRLRASLELLAGGVTAAFLLSATGLAIDAHLLTSGIDRLASPLFPLDGARLSAHVGRLCLALAVMWSITAIHARLLDRWRVHWRSLWPAVLAAVLLTGPSAALSLSGAWLPSVATVAPVMLIAALTAALAALAAAPLRRRYRRASQSTRLLLLFGAAVLPALVIDPIVSVSAQRATESAIETVHAPATVGHPEHLREQLAEAMAEVDRMNLDAGAALAQDAAFHVWRQTGLARGRLVSAVDLYGPDGDLVSRFALNVPSSGVGIDQSAAPAHCQWEVYGEVGSFGAEEMRMLHAERGLCDSSGVIQGAVVLHVVFDYRALPHLSARNPYGDGLRAATQASADGTWGIRTVVYGWSRLPIFTSGPSAWSIDIPLLERLERTRDGFWTTQRTEAGVWRVYFLNDRAGIYALGYPVAATFDHLTRLSETAALAALVFLLLLAVATVAAPLTQPRLAPMRAVVQEVRTSFYRKLFLFFVLTAIVPVGVLALTFSAYMGGQLRSDVETEAINAVTVARRVLEDTLALQQVPVTDDVMVWIGRVINQDVNVYDGSRLRATSQRDLFDSGVLSERTPAHAYRAVVLDRVPAFVEEHRAGPSSYLVASTPVPGPGLGRYAVLSVPLAPRQQEIEREISDLNRGVLFGAVCVMLLAAGLGAWVAQRVADPVARLTRATRQIASGRLDVRIVADTADELRRLVTDFNSMAATLRDQRAELGRAHELKAWADMSRQVAHDIKNPLTPIQLAAEHLQRVHEDRQRPLGPVFDQCIATVLNQVRLLRQIANEFSNFAAHPAPTLIPVEVAELLHDVVRPYRAGLADHTRIEVSVPSGLPPVLADKTLLARAVTNLVENALQAMPHGGLLKLGATPGATRVAITVTDDGIGMSADALERAFEPHFSTKTGGSGLGLANAKRNVESCGGTITATSTPGHGTTMTIRLPVALNAARADA